MFNDIVKVREYLYDRNVSVFGLEAISNLLDRLSHPEKNLKFIHITGTNGKGSTGSYISSILTASGYKVGAFSSPKVFCENEIIKINDDPISDDDFVTIFNKVYDVIETMQRDGLRLPTKFEIETAMSFLYFKMCRVDLVVMEVGLGGKLDSTNVVDDTMIEVVTRISYDHMGILGKTLKEIATHKSGIIKSGSTVITTGQDSEVMRVLKDVADSKGAKLIVAGDGTNMEGDIMSQTIAYKGREYKTRLLGNYQRYNLPIAIETAKELKRLGYKNITDVSILEGVEATRLEGRFEVIGTKPIFVLDGAHNDEASAMLRESIKTYFGGKKIIFILGIFKDKDVSKILANTIDLANEVVTFDWNNERHLCGEELRDKVLNYMSNAKYVKDSVEAVKTALSDAESGDVIVAFGSLSHLKEIKDAYEGVKNGRY